MFPFVLHGGEVFRTEVTAMWIVPSFLELEDRHPGFGLRLSPAAIEEFAFKGFEESIAQGIVIAVADQTHRGWKGKPERTANPVQTTGYFWVILGFSGSPVDAGNPLQYDDFPLVRALSSAG